MRYWHSHVMTSRNTTLFLRAVPFLRNMSSLGFTTVVQPDASASHRSSYFPAQNWCFGKSGQGRATTQDPPGATGGGFTEPDGEGGRIYRVARFSIARPMLMRLSAMTPRPTQRFIPASPL